jgi:putative ABC transport system permease protein
MVKKVRSQTELPEEFVMGSGLLSSVAPYVQSSFEASLIPAIDSLRSLAIVWIPGLMAGMLLSGARPAYAAIYQFVVLAMIFASSRLTSSALLRRTHVLSPAEQLVLRPRIEKIIFKEFSHRPEACVRPSD